MTFTPSVSATANFFICGGLPPGLASNTSTGVISGVPEKPGYFDVTIRPFSDSGVGEEIKVPFTILPTAGTPAMSSALVISGTAGTALSHALTATPAAVGFNIEQLPDFVVVDPLTGAVSGTPNTPGNYTFRASAFGAIGEGMPVTVTLQIGPAAGTPVVALQLPLPALQVGVPFSATLTTTPAATFYDSGSLPYGINLNSQTGIISGTPLEPGSDSVPVWGVNAQGIGQSLSLPLTISAASGTPAITSSPLLRLVEGLLLNHTFTTSPAANLFTANGLPVGWSFNPQTGLLQATPLRGTYNLTAEAWNVVGSGGKVPFQLRVFSGPAELWQDQEFGALATDPGIAAWDADPDRDGLVNLVERAFNLSPLQGGPNSLVAGTGTRGLPSISVIGANPSSLLRMEYIRLKASANSQLNYTPQFSSDLGTTWQDFTGTETVQSIDVNWERVTVEESATGQTKRFGRVKVVALP
jgi:hypothetical protein